MINDSQMYARNASGIGELPAFLQEMDKNEDAEIVRDKQKQNRIKNFTKGQIKGISTVSAISAVFGGSLLALIAMSPPGIAVAALSFGAFGGGVTTIGSMANNEQKADNELIRDRSVRLNSKIRAIAAKIPELSKEDAHKCQTASFYFQVSLEESQMRRSHVIKIKT